MGQLPTGTITFVLTDIVGSTALWEADANAMLAAVARHQELVGGLAAANAGDLIRAQGEGDSSFAVFAAPLDAVRYVRDLQRAFAAEPWPTSSPLVVRVAIHTGNAELHGGDYYGRAVNRCARIRAIANPGQALLSQATVSSIDTSLPDDVRFHRIGRLRLRDLVEPEEIYQLSIDGLPDSFPPPRSLEVVDNNLPTFLTSFIGREDEIARVRALLTEHRSVTLTGVGGAGKTRLAVQAAAELLDVFPGGVWVAMLAQLSDPALVAPTIAAAVGVTPAADGDVMDVIAQRLARAPSLLVLDNCEHIVEPCARLTRTLLERCEDLRVLATSREGLGVGGEAILAVPPMAVPAAGTLSELARHDAVSLFVERATAINPSFELTEENAGDVVEVCRRLDGIPLAIELAAARANLLAPAQIAKRLDERFSLLTKGVRDAEPRQQTLRGAIDWSYDLLGDEERALFAMLSVFAGTFSIEAAEDIAADEANVLETLSRLVERSLVVMETHEDAARYRMLESVRAYALERSAQAGIDERVGDAHARWYRAFARRARAGLDGAERARWLVHVDRELDNVRAAIDRLAARREFEAASDIVVDLRIYWSIRGFAEGRQRLEAALGGIERDDVREKVLGTLGYLAQSQGDLRAARRYKQEQLEAARATGDQTTIATALNDLGNIETEQAEVDAAQEHFEEALEIFRAQGRADRVATLLYSLGNVARMKRDLPGATALYDEALKLARVSNNHDVESAALFALGAVANNRRDLGQAERYYREALAVARSLGTDPDIAMILMALGGIKWEQGDAIEGRALLEESKQIHERLSYRLGVAMVGLTLAEIDRAAGDPKAARAHIEAAMPVIEESGARRPVGLAMEILADIERDDGNIDAAERALRDGVALRLGMRDAQGVAALLERAAGLAALREHHRTAAELFGAALAVRDSIGAPVPPSARARYEADVDAVRSVLGAEAFDDAVARGRALSLEEAATRVGAQPPIER
ncbi:MAG: tetratricopeptide repeat protein [Actinomycetota bacterium]|nr:tetratricopeptide repeat protein [Actinomycetota bacterium]